MSDDLKIRMPEWARHMYNRLLAKIDAGGGGGGGAVTGVKGDAESTYRTGQVNITPANIGALPANTPIPSKTSDLTNDSGFLTSSTGVTGVKGDAENSYRQGNVNLTYANVGAPSKDGTGASGTWGINITGNAATATKATQDGNGDVIPSTYVKKTDVIDISHGGSGMTGATTPYVGISNIVASTETGWEITEAYCSVWGKLASVKLRVKRTGSAITSSGMQSICTLRNELKPLVDSYVGVPSINVAGGALGVGGEVNIIVFDTWGQNSVKGVYMMYILA